MDLVGSKLATSDRATNAGVACLVSMGLDSFYSMNARWRDITSLPPVTPELIRGMPLRRPLAAQHHVENLRHLRNLSDAKRRRDLEDAITARLLEMGIVA